MKNMMGLRAGACMLSTWAHAAQKEDWLQIRNSHAIAVVAPLSMHIPPLPLTSY
jgi:hypothetical protein